MIRAWVGLVPSALGIAVSIMPLLFLILLLTSRRGLSNAVAFVVGWFLAIVMSVGMLVYIFERYDFSSQSAPSTAALALELAVGAILLLFGLYRLLQREQAEPRPPRWMNLADRIVPWMAFGVGVVGIVFNIKNLGLLLTGAAVILRAQLGMVASMITVCIYGLLASSTMLIPTGILVADREHGQERLERLRFWLIRHNRRVMGGLFVFLGLLLCLDVLEALLF